jgi:puromycin-sensitive aminopeptidase
MWFGDLVTMAWWNGLWLNEAFATFLEMVAVDAWKPEWQRWTTFGVSRAAALTVDGLHSTRPVEYPVAAPRDADAMFDVLTYEKGASVLRMMEQYLGPDVFRAGVRLYLERHKFANTETGDLWVALGEAARQPIPDIMDGWVFRSGYPLVRVERQGGELVLRQQRFTYLAAPPDGSPPAADAGRLWQVPVQLRLGTPAGETVQRLLLREEEARLPLPAGASWVLVNEGGHGFYRVRYSADLLAALLTRLPDGLAPIERFNLVNDAWAAVLAGLMPLADYLALADRFRGERDRNVWSILLTSLQAINRALDDEDRPAFAARVRHLLGEAWAALGWQARPGETELTRQLRGDLLRALGTLGEDTAAQAQAAELYARHRDDASGIDPNVWAAVIAVLGHTGDATRYEEFWARFRAAKSPQEEQRYLYALGGFGDAGLLARTLAATLSGDIRTQDAPLFLRALLMAPSSRAAAWAHVRDNWEAMVKAYPVPGLRRMCEGLIGLVRPEWEEQVHDFVRRRGVDLGGKTLRQYLEQLRIAVALRQREGANLHALLAPSGAR